MKSISEKYCSECGSLINVKAEICPKCGVRQAVAIDTQAQELKSKWLTTLLLCWFLGPLGVHRFYTGHTGIGIIQLFTLGGCGIWFLIDFIMIIVGNFKDADGNILKNA
ncbi:NINE protein [Myroides sp. M-43]|uniref:TM2 domain-containing protein n=1 Tax=Myroides oncorhynchi TaxID=2893756 RepID=UPI001E4E4A36|nr:TM2 domain-containing protein [Myroides oncorhynchi]MCC9043454.1 NINE protein [Myroides oncorhynchi]